MFIKVFQKYLHNFISSTKLVFLFFVFYCIHLIVLKHVVIQYKYKKKEKYKYFAQNIILELKWFLLTMPPKIIQYKIHFHSPFLLSLKQMGLK